MSQNVCVIKHLGTKRLITLHLCHTTKAVIKRQTSQKVNIIKQEIFQNITSQNENRPKLKTVRKQLETSNLTKPWTWSVRQDSSPPNPWISVP